MEENFYDDGFEEFLQKQVKDSRMYPSDGLWRNVYKEIHGDTNWPALTVAAFAFLGAIIFISIYFSPSPDNFTRVHNTSTYSNKSKSSKASSQTQSTANYVAVAPRRKAKLQPIPFIDNGQDEQADLAEIIVQKSVQEPLATLQTIEPTITRDLKPSKLVVVPASSAAMAPGAIVVAEAVVTSNSTPIENTLETTVISLPEPAIAPAAASVADSAQTSNKAFEEDFLTRSVQDPKVLAALKSLADSKKKFSYTVFIGASSSYRSLLQTEVIHGDGKNGPIALDKVVDVNKVVRHKPGTGIEAGITFQYAVRKNLRIKTGLQFNIRQYSMAAFMAPTEVATIGLINREGAVDSIGTYAVYRNSNGYMPIELVNRYYQISIPVGVEWKVMGNGPVQLHVAATIQPTYFVNRNAFLISTDYKNYTQNPDIMRKWNVNTSLETFVSVKSGDFRWQLGPQLRYQNLPSFIKAYPIREYLVDYGLKLGVSKIIQ